MQLNVTLLLWLPVAWGRYVEFVIGRNEMGHFEVGGCFFYGCSVTNKCAGIENRFTTQAGKSKSNARS